MLTRLDLRQMTQVIRTVLRWRDEGVLQLSPPYQRGDVWGLTRRVNFIRSLVLGVPIASIIVNDRLKAGWEDDVQYAVIDGKQRCTTLLMMFDGELRIPSAWLDPKWLATPDEDVSWAELSKFGRRQFSYFTLPFAQAQLPTVAMEQEVFELVNFGGVPQGQSDVQ